MYKMNPEYLIGIDLMDEQHQVLFELMEKAQKLLKDEYILYKYDDLINILNGLKEYTHKHFTEEIEFMESVNYPDIEAHKLAHKAFVDKINAFGIDFDKISLGTQDKMIDELLNYLIQWLQEHILDCDRRVHIFMNK